MSDSDDVSESPLPAWMDGDSLAPPCQADMEVVRAIIAFGNVTEDDVLYDLGCGDGRICIEAAESCGATACGVEIEEDLANKFRKRVACKGLSSKVTVVQGDLRDQDLSDATVIVTYLLPAAMEELAGTVLIPLLRKGKEPGSDNRVGGGGVGGDPNRGCRIICNTWGIPGLKEVKCAEVGKYNQTNLQLYTLESLQPENL
ncbi:unnamed protein product [Choristocarpus tenellus]